MVKFEFRLAFNLPTKKVKKNYLLFANKTKEFYRRLGWPSLFARIRFFTAPYEKLEKLVPKKGFIIDLGCGYGIFSHLLGLMGPKREILGIDLDLQKIKLAPQGARNVHFLQADITRLKLNRADVIVLVHVLHHLNSYQEQEKLLSECQKKISKKGKIIIAEVDRKPVLKYWLGWLADCLLYPGQKIFYRYPEDFKKIFSRLGFNAKIMRAEKNKPFAHIIYVLEKNEKFS